MSILRRIISSTTVRVLALLSIGLTAHADEHDRNEHGRKMVFAHYMVTNQDYQGDTDPHQEAKIAAYEKEIQQAQSAGIDGFALNCRRMAQPDLLHPVLCADLRSGEQPASYDAGNPPVANKYGPVADVIYITANLTQPATLKVDTGGESKLIGLPAGSTDTDTPFLPGNPPTFELKRNGLVACRGPEPIPSRPRRPTTTTSTQPGT
ncbi:MAG: hypothetical protein QOH85_172 [Acidobacteriaceae bacterium]|nr:hypothetical protein [Acidobacteriaceae bacterium]